MLGDQSKHGLMVRSGVDREETVGTSSVPLATSAVTTQSPFGGALTPLKNANLVGSTGEVWSGEVSGSMTA